MYTDSLRLSILGQSLPHQKAWLAARCRSADGQEPLVFGETISLQYSPDRAIFSSYKRLLGVMDKPSADRLPVTYPDGTPNNSSLVYLATLAVNL